MGAFNATVNNNQPDSRFFSWQGQAQWVRLLAEDTLLLLRTSLQISDSALVPIEQFGLGGIESVRGYRQDALLADNGVLASAEVRLPIYRAPNRGVLLQAVPFVDFGTTWDSGDSSALDLDPPDSDTLASIGLGLRLAWGDRLTARVDWGIPLIEIDSRDRTLQEQGIYFSIQYSAF